jgi:hypothetical protein
VVYRRTFAPLRSDRLRRPDDGQEVPACFLESARKLELPVHFCYRPRYVFRVATIEFSCIEKLLLHFLVD